MTVQIEQIDTWRSSLGSEMGDPAPAQQQVTGLDEVIPTTTVMHYCQQPVFKKPLAPVKRFQVQAMPPGKQARMASPISQLPRTDNELGNQWARVRMDPVSDREDSPVGQVDLLG